MNKKLEDIKELFYNPEKFFKSPFEVLHNDVLCDEDKLKILKVWAYDIGLQHLAEEENMKGESEHETRLEDIMECIFEVHHHLHH